MKRKKIVILSGAGISAESGIRTFRDADGLWEGHDVMEVASPQGWKKNPALVLDFYNQRRRQLLEVKPNPAHTGIAQLEENFEVSVVTQNVDDLHERGGSTQVLHLHGELLKVRSTRDPSLVMDWRQDLNQGDLCPLGSQLRPHIVWFGEEVPLLPQAALICSQADILVIVGTSLQVYPAAGLMAYAPAGIPVYYIDKNPQVNFELSQMKNLKVWSASASEGVHRLMEELE
jgi:NAD-dependent deacetylase